MKWNQGSDRQRWFGWRSLLRFPFEKCVASSIDFNKQARIFFFRLFYSLFRKSHKDSIFVSVRSFRFSFLSVPFSLFFLLCLRWQMVNEKESSLLFLSHPVLWVRLAKLVASQPSKSLFLLSQSNLLPSSLACFPNLPLRSKSEKIELYSNCSKQVSKPRST